MKAVEDVKARLAERQTMQLQVRNEPKKETTKKKKESKN